MNRFLPVLHKLKKNLRIDCFRDTRDCDMKLYKYMWQDEFLLLLFNHSKEKGGDSNSLGWYALTDLVKLHSMK